MLPVGVLAAFLGLVAKAMYPDAQAALALPQVIVGLQPVLAGVTLAALWAADVSTAAICCLALALCSPVISTSALSIRSATRRVSC